MFLKLPLRPIDAPRRRPLLEACCPSQGRRAFLLRFRESQTTANTRGLSVQHHWEAGLRADQILNSRLILRLHVGSTDGGVTD